MKKFVSFLIVVCMLSLGLIVYAESAPQLVIESVEAIKRETISVNINIKNNPGFAAMILDIPYDNNVLTPVSVEGCELLGSVSVVSNLQQGGDLKKYNPISLAIVSPTDITGDGRIFTITFDVSEDFYDDIELNISYRESDITNQNYEDVSFEIVKGYVKAKAKQVVLEENIDETLTIENIEDVEIKNEQPEEEKVVEQNPIVNTTNEIWVLVDNERVLFDQQPIIKQDRTLVPMRKIFEKLGADVDWDDETKTAIAKKDDIVISIQINNNIMKKGDEEVVLDVPAQLLNSRTLVPIRAISEAFRCEVDWISNSRTVTIKTDK